MKRMLIALALVFSVLAISPQITMAFVGFFKDNPSMNETRPKEGEDIPEWKACLTAPKEKTENGFWHIVFEKEPVDTTKPDCYQAWDSEADNGVVIYMDGIYYYAKNASEKSNTKDTASTTAGSGKRVVYGKMKKEDPSTLPYFLVHFEKNYRNRNRQTKAICILKEKSESYNFFTISFTVGQDPGCRNEAELREDQGSVSIRRFVDNKVQYFYGERTVSLITDDLVYDKIQSLVDNFFKKRNIWEASTFFYVSNEKYPVYPMNPLANQLGYINHAFSKAERKSLGDGFVYIFSYGPEEDVLPYSFFSYKENETNRHTFMEEAKACAIAKEMENIWPLNDASICSIYSIIDPRPLNKNDPLSLPSNRMNICLIKNSAFQVGTIYGFMDEECSSGNIYEPLLIR